MIDIKTAKLRLLQMHYEAGVGHIGGNLSCMEILWAISKVAKNTDRLVISKGHAAGACYIWHWATGTCEEAELSTFHKDNTYLAGHISGTGSLGHGLSKAAGIALHNKLWNKPGIVYCLTSDGEWDEGSTWEAMNFIFEHHLRVVVIVDANGLQGFKSASQMTFDRLSEYTKPNCCNGHNIAELEWDLREGGDCDGHVIWAMTNKGNGVSFLEAQLSSHYEPLTTMQYSQARLEIENA